MPVHPHHGAERLEPEWMSETPQQLVASVMMDDRLAHDRTEAGHAIRQPFRHLPAVQRQIGAARPLSHQQPSLTTAVRTARDLLAQPLAIRHAGRWENRWRRANNYLREVVDQPRPVSVRRAACCVGTYSALP